GKVFDRIRNDGYTISLSERESESAAIACPVFGVGQKLVCSISLGMPMFRFNRDVFDRTLPLVMQASQTLSQDLGGATDIFTPPYAIPENVTFPN
ncbi:MAG: IclR family transcriptional regulator domain-containing protein, partial [Advenella sp.]